MTVEQFIEKRADEKFAGLRADYIPIELIKRVFASGLREGIELMGEFSEWVEKNYQTDINGYWMTRYDDDTRYYATPDLIELFLKTKYDNQNKEK